MYTRYTLSIILFIFIVPFLYPKTIYAVQGTQIKAYPIHNAEHFKKTRNLKNIYYKKNFSLPYKSGKVVLSSTPDGKGPVTFFNRMYINSAGKNFSFGGTCKNESLAPIDIVRYLSMAPTAGKLQFSVVYQRGYCNNQKERLNGIWYQYANIGNLYVVHFDDSTNKPEPFLMPPWDYKADNLNMFQALSRIDKYFDHAYPLQSIGVLKEPKKNAGRVWRFDRTTPTDDLLGSGHDGYDWGARAGVRLGDSVLAAAGGTATYAYNRTYGHAIFIDHGNGYQTRYYHLQKNGLITTKSTTVSQGTKIGLVGASGRAHKPHIHFMVIRDKDGDGTFDNNIPDGIVDPFGWRSNAPDPWEEYTFTQNGTNKTGAKSYYLWKGYDRIQSRSTLHKNDNGYNLPLDTYTIRFPKYAVGADTLIQARLQNPIQDGLLHSIGSSMMAHAYDGMDKKVTQFNKPWNLDMKFNAQDIVRFDKNTLSIYSRGDDKTVWQKENTVIDFTSGKAQASIDHMTEFALMGEKLDNIAPVTKSTVFGGLDTSGVYTSDVAVFLSATDEPSQYSQGIDYILYKIGETDWTPYTNAFTLSGVGSYNISFFSADKDNNVEETKSIALTIDFTPLTPTATPTATPTSTPTQTPTPTTVYTLPIVPYLSSTPTPTRTPTPSFTQQSNALPPPNLSNRRTQSFLAQADPSPPYAPTVLGIFSSNRTPGTQDKQNTSQNFARYWAIMSAVILAIAAGIWWRPREEHE